MNPDLLVAGILIMATAAIVFVAEWARGQEV